LALQELRAVDADGRVFLCVKCGTTGEARKPFVCGRYDFGPIAPRRLLSQRVEPNARCDDSSRNAFTSPSVERIDVAHSGHVRV
jgi:hypothetical protein